MAFCNRFGSLLRQSSASKGQGSMGVLLNSSRCMSSTKVFVGGLSYGTDNQSLKEAFASFGDVIEARVITDRDTGRSKGFGFVNFDSEECANSAVSAMNGQEINGRNLRVSFANDRAPAPRRGGGGGGYRGRGYGDGGGYRGRGGGGYGDGGGYRGDGDYGGHDEY